MKKCAYVLLMGCLLYARYTWAGEADLSGEWKGTLKLPRLILANHAVMLARARLASIPVKEEISWSRNADEHVALLQLSALMTLPLSSELTATRITALPQQQQGASIAGTIVRSDTNEPVRGAQIMVSKVVVDPTEAVSNIPPVPTDPSGQFTLSNIPAGRYRLRAAASSYATQEYGSLLGGGSGAQTGAIFDLSASTTIRDLVIRLTPSATVSGRVLAATGETLLSTEVVLLRYRYDATGVRILSTEAVGTTDDRGEYRLAGIGPGSFVLCARSPMPDLNREYATRMNIPGIPGGPVPLAKYQTMCYPNAPGVESALPLQVQAGADIGSRDFTLLRGNTYLVRGRIVEEATGQPPRAVGFSVFPKPAVGLGRSSNSFGPMYKASDGTFEIGTFAPGSYWIVVTTATAVGQSLLPGTLDRLTTRVSADVASADVENVQIVLRKQVPLRGTVKVEGQQTLETSDYNNLRVSLVADRDGALPIGTRFQHKSITPDGSFQFENVLPDTYSVKFSGLPQDAFVKEARWGDADLLSGMLNLRGATDDTLSIVLSKRAGRLDGTLIGTNSLPAANREVVLIPNERKRSDLYRTSVSDGQGRFAIRGIPPGDYKLFAWDQIEPFGYFDAEVLRTSEPGGVPVRIEESARLGSEVRLIRASAGQ